jgi:DHA2 family multidrug resistance protein
MFIFGLGMFGSVFLIPVYLQNIMGYTALQSGMVLLPVGIIQAICSPIGGYFSDKVNPKIPISIGIVLFAISFYLNTYLTIYSEHTQIMIPMYLRGIAMGVLFSSLSAVSVAEISRQDMAQASGLMNVIRQVGGSFGVAILQTLLSQRIIFHTAAAGEIINRTSPLFAQSQQLLKFHAMHDIGSSVQNAAAQATMLFSSQFEQQIFVWAINDAFLFSCICTSACLLPILILKTKKQRQTV